MVDGFVPGEYKNLKNIGLKDPDGFSIDTLGKGINENEFENENEDESTVHIDSEEEHDSDSEYNYASSSKDEESGTDTDNETEPRKIMGNIFPARFNTKKPQKKLTNVKILQEEEDFTSED